MSELKLQQQIYIWFYNEYPEYRISTKSKSVKAPRCLLYHNLTNAKSKIEAAKLNGCGLTKGLPDLFLAVPRGGKAGLYLELKIGSEKPKDYQHEVMEKLEAEGYAVDWVNNLVDAKAKIEHYLGQPKVNIEDLVKQAVAEATKGPFRVTRPTAENIEEYTAHFMGRVRGLV